MAKKKTKGANKLVSKKAFKSFESGVQRLKEIGKELGLLNTDGFAVETASIKSKLKSVSKVLEVEKEMSQLKIKIKSKYNSRKKKKQGAVEEIVKVKKQVLDDWEAQEKRKFLVERKLKDLEEEMKTLGGSLGGINAIKKDLGKIDSLKESLKGIEKDVKKGYKLAKRNTPDNEFENKIFKILKKIK